MNIFLSLLTVWVLALATEGIDPCKDSKPIPNLGLRYINYRIDEHDAAFHDHRLPAGWYNVGADTMPETAPDDIFTCGTKFPIWLQGTHPKGNAIVNMTACQLSLSNDCASTYDIRIKHCGANYVYFLRQTSSSTAGYCFGIGAKGTRSKYIVHKPIFGHKLKKTYPRPHRPKTEVMFICTATPSATEDLYYMVSWYGDGQLLYNTPVAKPIDSEQLQMDETTFKTHGFKMGQDITCAVTPFTKANGPPGKLSVKADAKLIGIKVLTTSLSFQSGETDISKKMIRVKPTVSIGCTGAENCKVQLTTFLPANTSDRMCTNSLGFKDSTCGIRLHSNNYSSIVGIEIEDIDTGKYSQDDGIFDVFLKTEDTDENIIWKEYLLPRITVHIKAKHVKTYQGKSCTSVNDPHIKTFDGRSFDNHQNGVFIMYKHVSYDAEIQVTYRRCSWRNVGGVRKPIMCNCGVAVRAGLTLYVIDICSNRLKFDFKSCGDDALVVKNQGEKKFTLTFTYGTYAVVLVSGHGSSYVLSVEVIPSSHDQGDVTRGLCGIMDGNCANDHHDRGGKSADPTLQNGPCSRLTDAQWSYEHQPLKFIDIWRVKPPEVDLFDDNVGPKNFKAFDQYTTCVCRKQPPGTLGSDYLYNKIPCIKDTVAKCLPGTAIKGSHTCAPAARSKRSVHRNPFIPVVTIDDMEDREKRDAGASKNWTVLMATDFCQKFMGESPVFSLCGEVPNVKPNSSIENCIADIMLTGGTSWSDISMETMQDSCLSELQRNTTLRETSSKNETSLAEKIEKKACPNNCSKNGLCDDGKCICHVGLGGSDCSIDLTVGPTISGLLDHGLCDEQELECEHAFVFGRIFTSGSNLTCRMEEFSISEDGTRQKLGTHHVPGEFETMVEVICPVKPTRHKRSVVQAEFVIGYTISVSNDGKLYQPGHDLFIYDSECQLVTNISNQMHFSLKDGYCFINNVCVHTGTRNPADNCTYCDHSKKTRSWTLDDHSAACVSTHTTKPTVLKASIKPTPSVVEPDIKPSHDDSGDSKSNYLWIIGVVAGVIVGAVIATVVIIKLTKGRAKKVGDSTIFEPPAGQASNVAK